MMWTLSQTLAMGRPQVRRHAYKSSAFPEEKGAMKQWQREISLSGFAGENSGPNKSMLRYFESAVSYEMRGMQLGKSKDAKRE